MADETPKTFTFRFADTSKEQAELVNAAYKGDIEIQLPEMDKHRLAFGINMVAYEKMAQEALKPDLFLFNSVPAKPLNRRQKARRFLRNVKQTRLQRLHDWAQRKGAYCDSDY